MRYVSVVVWLLGVRVFVYYFWFAYVCVSLSVIIRCVCICMRTRACAWMLVLPFVCIGTLRVDVCVYLGVEIPRILRARAYQQGRPRVSVRQGQQAGFSLVLGTDLVI